VTVRSPEAVTPATLSEDVRSAAGRFVAQTRFATHGGIVTDLDGTAVHERGGRVVIADSVEAGLKALAERGRAVVVNSLRFPLSIIRSFGREWHAVIGAPVPTVSLNGSLIGHIVADNGSLAFEEIDAFPLAATDIDEALTGLRALVDDGVDDVTLFYYPRDWRKGEIVWTTRSERIAAVADKYDSACAVVATGVEALAERLHGEDICMMMLIADVPRDRRMAYQHTAGVVTTTGIDKLSGARAIAHHVGIDLAASAGAGDTDLDTFLGGVGLSIVVGDADLDLRGRVETVRLADSLALGALFFELASLIDGAPAARAGGGAPPPSSMR
jgi:hydroxymethylpyrimidine pyrophosphatase-like HAD family hydrolase